MADVEAPARGPWFTHHLAGLRTGVKARPQVLGRRGSRMVVDATHVRTETNGGLVLYPLKDVFDRPSVLIGFGLPNAYLTLPNADGTGWDKLNAFMFFRQASYVAGTKGRVQAGVGFELPGLAPEVVEALRAGAVQRSASRWTRRGPSCAWSVAHVLAGAGFRLGNGWSLTRMVRPSKLAARIWEHGLSLHGRPVRLRVIQTGRDSAEHFRAVWGKEADSPRRTIQKLYHGKGPGRAPVFEERKIDAAQEPGGPLTTLGISRPSWLGVHLGFVLGEQPIFSVDHRNSLPPELSPTLQAYPGKLGRTTALKRYVLFSKPVIAFLRYHLVRRVEWHTNIAAGALPPMLRVSTRERETAFTYNYVITGTELRLKRLANGTAADRAWVNWILAKHVLVSGYDPDVRIAGECWAYRRPDGALTLVMNVNSGTYKPDQALAPFVAELATRLMAVPVEVEVAAPALEPA